MQSNIYIITNLINGKMYVGQTINPESRFQQHKRDYKKGKNTYLYNAFRKYGIDNFEYRVIETHIEITEINEREQFWINKLNTKSPYGYNLTFGGEGTIGYKHTDETKEKLSNMKKGIPTHKQSEETRHKISMANKGNKPSKKAVELAIKANAGRVISDEQKDKISKSLKGRPKSDSHKKKHKELWENYSEEMKALRIDPLVKARSKEINMIDPSTKIAVQTFSSSRKAAEWIRYNTENSKASHTRIGVVCGDLTKTAYGFNWVYNNKV